MRHAICTRVSAIYLWQPISRLLSELNYSVQSAFFYLHQRYITAYNRTSNVQCRSAFCVGCLCNIMCIGTPPPSPHTHFYWRASDRYDLRERAVCPLPRRSCRFATQSVTELCLSCSTCTGFPSFATYLTLLRSKTAAYSGGNGPTKPRPS